MKIYLTIVSFDVIKRTFFDYRPIRSKQYSLLRGLQNCDFQRPIILTEKRKVRLETEPSIGIVPKTLRLGTKMPKPLV